MHVAARRTARYLILVFVALAACVGSSAQASGEADARLLVKLRASTPADAAQGLLSTLGAEQMGALADLNIDVVSVPSSRRQAALDALRKSPLVEYAEPDAMLQPQELLPNDPSFPTRYAVAGGAWGWTKTHTTQAWDITRGDPSVVVAILDTGLKTSGLDDFTGQVVPGWNVLKGSSDVSSAAGTHGTYVAGAVALALGNNVGNAGYCPGCRIMPVQVGSDTGAYLSDLASGLTWAADHGARVANMSWAGSSSSSTLASAVSYARSKGMVVTAAAGNSGCDCPTYPAATPGVLGVASTDQFDAKEPDSNYGSWVKLAAPEGNMTAWPSLNGAPGYAPVGGTSLAAPVVAAFAGLLFSANPSLSGQQVEQALESSAVPESFVQYGRVDALAALNALGFSDPQSASVPVNDEGPRLLLETNGDYNTTPLTGPPQVGQVLLRGQGSWTGSAPLSLTSVQWQRCDAAALSCTTVATVARYTVQAADTGYELRVRITVGNGVGSTTAVSPLSDPVGGAAAAMPPVNTSPPTISGTQQDGQTLTASPGSWTGSPTTYAYQWERCDSSGGNCAAIAGATSTGYAAQTSDVGQTLRVSVTASNSSGAAVAVSAQTGLIAAAPSPAPAPSPTSQTLTFSSSLNPANPTRTFSVTVGSGATHAGLSFSKCKSLVLGLSNGLSATGPSVLALDANLAAGTYTYTVSGGRCSFALTVTGPAG